MTFFLMQIGLFDPTSSQELPCDRRALYLGEHHDELSRIRSRIQAWLERADELLELVPECKESTTHRRENYREGVSPHGEFD